MALFTGFVASMRPVQAKWVKIKNDYEPFDFTIDSGFVTGSILFIVWVYFALTGHPSYTWKNAIFSFFASIMLMFWGLVGLYA